MQSSNSNADLLEFTTILSSHKDTEAPRCQTIQSEHSSSYHTKRVSMYLNYLMYLNAMRQESQKRIQFPGEEALKLTSVEHHQSTVNKKGGRSHLISSATNAALSLLMCLMEEVPYRFSHIKDQVRTKLLPHLGGVSPPSSCLFP